jgi:hypothetical protein
MGHRQPVKGEKRMAKTYSITTLLETKKNASLSSGWKSRSGGDGDAIEPWKEDAGSTGENIKTQIRSRSYYESR